MSETQGTEKKGVCPYLYKNKSMRGFRCSHRIVERRLGSMFSRGWYWHGNEPCHQIAYLYSAIGKQNKKAHAVRHIMDTEYMNTPGGLSGNDDAGQMSAWYVFSALEFYPLCPSTPYYYLGIPAFPHTTIHLSNGKGFTIKINGTQDRH